MKLLNCDSIEFMKGLPDECIDLIVTDPPYRIDTYGSTQLANGSFFGSKLGKEGKVFSNNDVTIKDYAGELYRILKPQSHCYIMTNNFNLIEMLNTLTGVGFHFTKNLIWDKGRKVLTPIYMQSYEYVILVTKGKFKRVNNCGIGDILSVPQKKLKGADGKNLHDTEKPVGLMEILVTQSSLEGETVLDPFMGIGSTGIACVKHNREFIGCEIDKKYFDIAVQRIDDEKGKLKLDI